MRKGEVIILCKQCKVDLQKNSHKFDCSERYKNVQEEDRLPKEERGKEASRQASRYAEIRRGIEVRPQEEGNLPKEFSVQREMESIRMTEDRAILVLCKALELLKVKN
jgi:hypothetical protein